MRGVPWLALGGAAAVVGLVLLGLAVAGVRLALGRQRYSVPLVATFVLALGVLGLTTGLLLADRQTSESDALRTGGLAAAAVVALYGLWLNDRRRQVEESRRQLETARAEHDRDRTADERFAKSVELLGHTADQVRVGAMHALAALGAARPDHTQTVLDVLCAYLRRPFDLVAAAPDAEVDQRELQVRLTAQRLIARLLTPAGQDGPHHDLDLTGVVAQYLDLSGRRIGELLLRGAELHRSTNVGRAEITGNAYFTDAVFYGPLRCRDTTFRARAWFSGVSAEAWASFTGTRFAGATKLAGSTFAETADFTGCTFAQPPDLAGATFGEVRGLAAVKKS